MRSELYKYPRTLHLPFTQHSTTDDKIMSEADMLRIFSGKEVVVTEKLDGENTNLYPDWMHARSLDGRDHPTRHWVKGLWGSIKKDIPTGWRISGENVFAEHSIHYRNLESYFYVFGVWNEANVCLSWDDTVAICDALGLKTVPVLWRGIWSASDVRAQYSGKSTFRGSYDSETFRRTGQEVEAQEGYVVRLAEPLPFPVGEDNERLCLEGVGKFVRKGHVTTADHWLDQVPVKNELKEQS